METLVLGAYGTMEVTDPLCMATLLEPKDEKEDCKTYLMVLCCSMTKLSTLNFISQENYLTIVTS